MVTEQVGNDVEFITKADKGVVVCKLYNCEEIALNRVIKQCSASIPFNVSSYLIDDVYVGVAKCAPEDTFDEETGKQIALTRAKRKRCQAANNAIKKYISDINKDLARLRQYGIHEVPVVEVN